MIEDAKKQQKQQQQRQQKIVESKYKKRTQYVQTEKGIKKRLEEDNVIREFFKRLADMPDDQVVTALEKFAFSRSSYIKRFFTMMINQLPDKFYKKFAVAYTSQTEKYLEDFYTTYIKRKEVGIAILKKQITDDKFNEQLDLEANQKMELKKLGLRNDDETTTDEDDDKTTDEDEDEDRIPTPKSVIPVERRQTKMLDIEGKEIPTPPRLKPERPSSTKLIHSVDINCLEHQRIKPWINGRVVSTYIVSVDGSNIDKYILEQGKTHQEGNTTWYPVNKFFTELMCNNYADLRTQDGEVLTVFTSERKPVRMKVAYATNHGFIVQDESIFDIEKKYLEELRMTRQQKVQRLLDSPVNDVIKELGVYRLSI